MSKTYPIDATDEELAHKSAELSTRVLAYDPKTGNLEDLLKDSILFNTTYIERQSRGAAKATRQMVWLAWASSFVAIGSLVVAWMAYDASLAADKWQAEQLKLLQSIVANTASAKTSTASSTQLGRPLGPTSGMTK